MSSRGNQSSVTAVKADLTWPTLTDDRSDTRDVSQFYEEFEDVCALANNCKGMSFREQLLALRGRRRGSRLKTSTSVYRGVEGWKGRVDSEHALLMKGKLSGHQFATQPP